MEKRNRRGMTRVEVKCRLKKLCGNIQPPVPTQPDLNITVIR
jgi:hypothetical protein